MAYIYYHKKFKTHTYDPLGSSFNILNWRVLKNDIYMQGRDVVEGVTLVANSTIFIPHIVIEDIHNFNREKEHDDKVKQFYTERGVLAPNICFRCWGKGKLDWVQQATGVMGPIPNVEFIRDRTSILIYPGFDNIIFGRSVLEEDETYCHACRGTGIQLHAKRSLFKGMKRLRRKLKPVITKIEV